MAANEEKISGKRRKLFKALSAAPVVATLHPGSALATDSAFQCALKIASGDSEPHLTGIGPFEPVTDNFVKVEGLTYWLVADAQPVSVGGVAVTPCEPIDNAISYIVYFNGDYYDDSDPGNVSSLADRLPTNPPAAGGTLEVKNAANVVCLTIAGSTGDFAMLGAILDNGTSYQETGVYPAVTQTDNYGMTTTCMNSLVEAEKYNGLGTG